MSSQTALVDGARAVADPQRRAVQRRIHVIANAIASASAAQSPPHSSRASSWFPSQSQSPVGMSSQTALVDVAGSVADAASVEASTHRIHIIADAIVVGVGRAVTTAFIEGVELVSVAVAVASRDVFTTALVDVAWAVADPASVEASDTWIHIVADAIASASAAQSPPQLLEGVELVSVAVAVASGDVFRASAVVDGAWAVADPAVVELADAVVDVIADAIAVSVCCAVATAVAEGVELVSVAVAVSSWDAGTPAVVDGARSVADPAVIELADAVVRSSQTPSLSASAAQSPPQLPRASSWLPSQSQSPGGMPEHPQS